MEIAFINLVTLKCYADKRNNVYQQLTFFTPSSLSVETLNALDVHLKHYSMTFLSRYQKNNKLKNIKKPCNMSLGKY